MTALMECALVNIISKEGFSMKKFIPFLTLLPLLASCGGGGTSSTSSSASIPFLSSTPAKIEVEYEIPSDEELVNEKDANADKYGVWNVTPADFSLLKGKMIYFLGSSVTYGASSGGVAMAEYLSAKTGCLYKKDAVSGTTLFDDNKTGNTGANSYVRRMEKGSVFDINEHVDAFVCQISTNDCTNDRLSKRGAITGDDVLDMESFDRATTLGAIEYIVAYVTEYWGCPVYFYSGGYFGDGTDKAARQNNNPKGSEYGKLVDSVLDIAAKWNRAHDFAHVGVIDMYHDEEFNAKASDAYYKFGMNDPIHPRKAAYKQWWTPYIEAFLENEVAAKQF